MKPRIFWSGNSTAIPTSPYNNSAQNKSTKEHDLAGDKSTALERHSDTLVAKGTGSARTAQTPGIVRIKQEDTRVVSQEQHSHDLIDNRRWEQPEILIWTAVETNDAQEFSYNWETRGGGAKEISRPKMAPTRTLARKQWKPDLGVRTGNWTNKMG
jgi:hypothetical protein